MGNKTTIDLDQAALRFPLCPAAHADDAMRLLLLELFAKR